MVDLSGCVGRRKSTPQLSVPPLEAGELHVGSGLERLPGASPKAAASVRRRPGIEQETAGHGHQRRGGVSRNPTPHRRTEVESLSKSTGRGWAAPAKGTTLCCL